MWVTWHRTQDLSPVTDVAGTGAVVSFVALLVYVYLIVVQTYTREIAVSASATRTDKVIGGFWLTPEGRKQAALGKTVQDIFAGMAYRADNLWPRPARALAKLSFIASYVLLMVAGTVALAAAGILISSVHT